VIIIATYSTSYLARIHDFVDSLNVFDDDFDAITFSVDSISNSRPSPFPYSVCTLQYKNIKQQQTTSNKRRKKIEKVSI